MIRYTSITGTVADPWFSKDGSPEFLKKRETEKRPARGDPRGGVEGWMCPQNPIADAYIQVLKLLLYN